MKTLLVLTRQPSMSAAIQSVLESQRYQIVSKQDVWDADSLLSRGVIDAVILDADLIDVKAIRVVEKIRKTAPACPVLIYASTKQWEWEEDAYLLGVEHVLMKPVRTRILNTLLDRIFKEQDRRRPKAVDQSDPVQPGRALQGLNNQVRALETLHRFSGILSHCLNPDALLREVLLLIRELINVNRAVIFLRNPVGLLGEGIPGEDDHSLRSGCAIGLEPALLKHFTLSLSKGIGSRLRMQGRILKASSPEALSCSEITKEFQILGARVAIPILDRETLIGIAVFDERLTGESYDNEELALIFHMFEQVGLAIRNSWLHDQLVNNHSMITDILGTLPCGCVVISDNLEISHANAVAKKCLLPGKGENTRLEFANLPQDLGSKVFRVITNGNVFPPFQYQFPHQTGVFYQATVTPFPLPGTRVSRAALLLIEDITERIKAQKIEMEASNLRLVASMAAHLAHEIGNAIAPLSTHQQLLDEKINDLEFRDSLSITMAEGVKRISRLARQMIFLAGEQDYAADEIRITDLLAEAWRGVFAHLDTEVKPCPVSPAGEWIVLGNRKALLHAFFEILLNALLPRPSQPGPSIQVSDSENSDGGAEVRISILNSGEGFSLELGDKTPPPIFSIRNVGLGVGLTVARKIIENHNGRIELESPGAGSGNVLRITLPVSSKTDEIQK